MIIKKCVQICRLNKQQPLTLSDAASFGLTRHNFLSVLCVIDHVFTVTVRAQIQSIFVCVNLWCSGSCDVNDFQTVCSLADKWFIGTFSPRWMLMTQFSLIKIFVTKCYMRTSPVRCVICSLIRSCWFFLNVLLEKLLTLNNDCFQAGFLNTNPTGQTKTIFNNIYKQHLKYFINIIYFVL